jgi:hypothetical protein
MYNCPLCETNTSDLMFQDDREFYLCPHCQLIFVPPYQHLIPDEEKSRYDQHRNNPKDSAYRLFLGRLTDPLLDRLTPSSTGLDFGCGPGPTLSVMLEEAGHQVAIYDPFYADDPDMLKNRYDFITATEVVEHLHHPIQDLGLLWSLLRPAGYLGLMTKLSTGRDTFAVWHYKRDLTHVCFFSRQTFEWLADSWQAGLEFHGDDVIIIRKSPDALS